MTNSTLPTGSVCYEVCWGYGTHMTALELSRTTTDGDGYYLTRFHDLAEAEVFIVGRYLGCWGAAIVEDTHISSCEHYCQNADEAAAVLMARPSPPADMDDIFGDDNIPY